MTIAPLNIDRYRHIYEPDMTAEDQADAMQNLLIRLGRVNQAGKADFADAVALDPSLTDLERGLLLELSDDVIAGVPVAEVDRRNLCRRVLKALGWDFQTQAAEFSEWYDDGFDFWVNFCGRETFDSIVLLKGEKF